MSKLRGCVNWKKDGRIDMNNNYWNLECNFSNTLNPVHLVHRVQSQKHATVLMDLFFYQSSFWSIIKLKEADETLNVTSQPICQKCVFCKWNNLPQLDISLGIAEKEGTGKTTTCVQILRVWALAYKPTNKNTRHLTKYPGHFNLKGRW